MNFQKYILDALKRLPLTKDIQKNLKLLRTVLIGLVVLIVVQIVTAIITSTYFMMQMIRG